MTDRIRDKLLHGPGLGWALVYFGLQMAILIMSVPAAIATFVAERTFRSR